MRHLLALVDWTNGVLFIALFGLVAFLLIGFAVYKLSSGGDEDTSNDKT